MLMHEKTCMIHLFIIFTGYEDMHKCLNEFNFCHIPPLTTELSAFEKLTYNIVAILVPSFMIGSSSFLQVTRTTIKCRKILNFGQI